MLSPAEKRNGLAAITEKPRKPRQGHQVFGPSIPDLAARFGIDKSTLASRVRRSRWDIHKALTTPIMSMSEAGRRGKAKQMEERQREQT